MKSLHTPGPWVAGHRFNKDGSLTKELLSVYTMQGCRIADCCALVDMQSEGEGNARLIAAAPELLEALRRMVKATDHWQESNAGHASNHGVTAREQARALIAKADGTQGRDLMAPLPAINLKVKE